MPPTGRSRPGAAAWFAMILLAALTLVCVLIPGAVTAVRTLARLGADWPGRWALAEKAVSVRGLVGTVVVSAVIGFLALLLAVPAGLLMARAAARRTGGAGVVALVLTPLLLPSYLPYAGWSVIRGPNTWFGGWLAHHDPVLTLITARATAVLGMSLWIWPLAALVLAGAYTRIGAPVGELARVDAPSAWSRARVVASAMRGGLVASAAVVVLVMLGSAVPLQVAQVPTYAIGLWEAMQLTPDTTGVWVAATPLVVLAALAAGVVVRAAGRALETRPESGETVRGSITRPAIAAAAVWALSVLVPLALFAWSLKSWRSVPMFWRLSGRGVAQSLRLAGWTGAGVMLLAVLVWVLMDLGGSAGRKVARLAVWVFMAAGLVPGVLVGAAMAAAWNAPPLDRLVGGALGGPALVVVTHLARFGFIGALGGWWLASLEAREQRWLRTLEGGNPVRSWLTAAVRPRLAGLVGLGLCGAALSFHEIESTVFVLPPGLANLPQQLLDALHYAREEQLSAAAINLLGLGCVGGFVALVLVARVAGRNGRGANVQRSGAE